MRYGRKRWRDNVKKHFDDKKPSLVKQGLHTSRVLELPDQPSKHIHTMEFASFGTFVDACECQLTGKWQSYDSFRAGNPAKDFDAAINAARFGDDSMIAASDKLMDELEKLLPEFKLAQWERVNDVVGALPNVPAYLTGEPLNMIRRRRIAKQEAPLSIFVDLICTWNVPDSVLVTRGAAILALTRILSTRRAVTLYVGMQADKDYSDNQCSISVIPVDTAPLDLARAAYMFSHASFNRGMLYTYAREHAAYNGLWAWNNDFKHRDLGQSVCKAVFGNDVLYIPPAQTQDTDYHVLKDNPATWIRERVIKYGMEGLSDD